MKRTLGTLLIAGTMMTMTGAAFAQHGAAPKTEQKDLLTPSAEDQERYLTALSTARRKLFAESMNDLSAEQLQTFWSIYSDYEKDKNDLALARVELVKKYVQSFANAEGISDADVTETIKTAADVQKKQIDLRLKYFNTMASRIGAKAAGRFALTDDYVQTAVRLDWLNAVPFPGDQPMKQAAPAK